MCDERPILLEDEIRAVVPVVTDDAAAGGGRRVIVAGLRHLEVFGAGTMTSFALDVGELRRQPERQRAENQQHEQPHWTLVVGCEPVGGPAADNVADSPC